jgi:hypothetical protein
MIFLFFHSFSQKWIIINFIKSIIDFGDFGVEQTILLLYTIPFDIDINIILILILCIDKSESLKFAIKKNQDL